MNYYERHLGDYARDTGHLSILEHGVYNILLDRIYATEQGIPDGQKYRYARARTDEEKQAVDAVLSDFFTLSEGVWFNQRACDEIKKAAGRIASAQENGKRGGRPKKPNPSETETGQKPNHFETETGQKPNHFETETGQKPNPSETETGQKPNPSETETQSKAYQAPSTKHQTPEGIQAAAVDQPVSREGPNAAADHIHARAIELTSMLRQRGAALQASDPRLRRWAETGITDAQAIAALETAQQRREEQGNHQPINAGYLDAILKDATGTGTPTKRRGNIHEERAATIAGLTGRDRKADYCKVIDGSAVVVD